MPTDDGTRTARQALGHELRRLREAAGLSLRQFGSLLPLVKNKQSIPHARIQRIEIGNTSPDPETGQLRDWLNAVRATPADRERVAALARDVYGATSRWSDLAVLSPDMQAIAAERERNATGIHVVCHQWLPGLLQTRDYAHALLTLLARDGYPVDPDTSTDSRIGRQAILRVPGRVFRFLITEHATRWNPDPERVSMPEQMGHVQRVAELPDVAVRVLSSTAPVVGPWASFTVYGGERPAVGIELEHHLDLVLQPSEVDRYQRRFEEMWDAAEPVS